MAEDHVARQAAALANQKIDSHEDRCGERWQEARNEMRTLHTRISETKTAINSGYKKLLWSLIGGLGALVLVLIAAILAYLFAK